jgi:hypothetical protein
MGRVFDFVPSCMVAIWLYVAGQVIIFQAWGLFIISFHRLFDGMVVIILGVETQGTIAKCSSNGFGRFYI